MLFLTEHAKLVRLNNAAVAGQTTLTSTFSRAGYTHCLLIALLGDVTATSALALTGKTGDESNGSDAVAVSGAVADFTAGASDADNKILAVDMALDSKDYVTWTLARGTANAVVDGVFALLYNARTQPEANGDSTLLELAKAVAK